jgi:uncharacterized membrane protein SpoIIM required for sporulation
MIELLINPKRAERQPWQMGIVGLIFGLVAMFAADKIFSKDPVLSQYATIFVIIFSVILTIPYIYYTMKYEERKDVTMDSELKLLREHSKAIFAFIWLFVGFVLAFSLYYILMPDSQNLLKAQIETFCQINRGSNYQECIKQYGLTKVGVITGNVTGKERFFSIFSNNMAVLIFTIVLSLIFGAGAIFILAWNASVIAAAIAIFIKSNLAQLPMGFARYMLLHGIPEIAAYFVGALAGGILSLAVIRRDLKGDKLWNILQDALYLVIIAIIILILAGLIEVFITPKLF